MHSRTKMYSYICIFSVAIIIYFAFIKSGNENKTSHNLLFSKDGTLKKSAITSNIDLFKLNATMEDPALISFIKKNITQPIPNSKATPVLPLFSKDGNLNKSAIMSDIDLFKLNASMEDPALISFIKKNMTQPIPTSMATPVLANRPANLHWSLMQEAEKVDLVLKGRTNGFFVEFGAADGETYSNTLYFELKYNWTGLLVEANPGFFKSLVNKKRNAYAFNGCLSTSKTAQQLKFAPQSFYGGLVDEFKSQERRLRQNIDNSQQIAVQCAPLYSIMLALNKTKIDFFSLNTEGGELNILKTIPFDKLDIDVVVVEYLVWHGTDEQGKVRIKEFQDFFKKLGNYSNGTVFSGNVFFYKNKK